MTKRKNTTAVIALVFAVQAFFVADASPLMSTPTSRMNNQDFLSVLKVLEPLNVYRADRASRRVFEDFFMQKERAEYPDPDAAQLQTPKPASNNSLAAPQKLHRQGF